jgi:membrane protease YdiL (CAAX protease family)
MSDLEPTAKSPFKISDLVLGYGTYALVLVAFRLTAATLESSIDPIVGVLSIEALALASAVLVVVARRSPPVEALGLPIVPKDRIGFLFSLPALIVIEVLLSPLRTDVPDTDQLGEFLIGMRFGGPMVLTIVLLVIVTPLLEELLYRGALHGILRQRLDRIPTVLVGAALFAAANLVGLTPFDQQTYVSVLFLFLFGLVAATAREVSGRIGTAFFFHSSWNAIFLLTYFMSEAPS